METIATRALKSSFLSEIIGLKSTQKPSFDDFSVDEFSVDDLLDLSDKDFNNFGDGDFEELSEEDFASVSSHDNDTNSSNFSSSGDLASLMAAELNVPIDDMESLEWLSNIVDDSVTELQVLYPALKMKERTGEFSLNRFEPEVNVNRSFTVLGLPYPVQKKCRTARSRKPGRVWSTGSASLTESPCSSSSSHDSSIIPPMVFIKPVQYLFYKNKPAVKKQRKNPVYQTTPGSSKSPSQRQCTHCQVQKTPQWRTGPLGPKTLCNACGVRFKSGRLYPEYRPACSPTFSDDLHSNSHRKVLELRKKKEPELEPVLNMAIQIRSGSLLDPVQ